MSCCRLLVLGAQICEDALADGIKSVSANVKRNYLWLAVLSVFLIIFASLYPFKFQTSIGGPGAWNTLIESWNDRPGRIDLLINILFYLPLGLLGGLALRFRLGARVIILTVFGGLLSTGMELSQYYDLGRVTSASDVYANTFGTLLGCFMGSVSPTQLRIPFLEDIHEKPVPAAILAVWCAYSLYPYVPSIDIHKYWDALKPLVLRPELLPYDAARHTVIWLTLFMMIEAVVGRRYSTIVALVFTGCVLLGHVVIVDSILTETDVVSACFALCLWPMLLLFHERVRAVIVCALLAACVVAERLEPFQFLQSPRPFGWIPFRGFMYGSLQTNVLSFMEKTFFYGSLLVLLCTAGLRMGLSAFVIGGMLFATSWAERFLPDRSAEITDACMALLIAFAITLQRSGSTYAPTTRMGNQVRPPSPG